MKRDPFLPKLALPAIFALLLACGGGSSSTTEAPAAPATSFAYTDPTAGAGDWKLVEDATSTNKHLVLNLVGPSDGSKYRGIGFTLQTDTSRVKIAQFTDGAGKPTGYYRDGGIFLDKDGTGFEEVPVTLQAGGVDGNKLMVGLFQRTDDGVWKVSNGAPIDGARARNCYDIVLQIALDFDPALKAMPGDVPLAVVKARLIPEVVDTVATRRLVAVPIKVGTLRLK